MNFSGPAAGRARVDAPNWANTNMALKPYDLRIYDARPIADAQRVAYSVPNHINILHKAIDKAWLCPVTAMALAGINACDPRARSSSAF